MKKYIIALTGVLIFLLISIIFKYHYRIVCHHFPIPKSLKKNASPSSEIPLYLFFFFSKNDCLPCVREVLEIMNSLQPHFTISGVVPEQEFENQNIIKDFFKITFPLFSNREFRNYLPWHTPTLFGISPSGKILFILPGITGQMDYLETTIKSIYGKLYPTFIDDK